MKNLGYLETYSNYNPRPHVIKESRSNSVNDLCLKNTSIKTFRWLFDNNIELSTKNIQNLIIKNLIQYY